MTASAALRAERELCILIAARVPIQLQPEMFGAVAKLKDALRSLPDEPASEPAKVVVTDPAQLARNHQAFQRWPEKPAMPDEPASEGWQEAQHGSGPGYQAQSAPAIPGPLRALLQQLRDRMRERGQVFGSSYGCPTAPADPEIMRWAAQLEAVLAALPGEK